VDGGSPIAPITLAFGANLSTPNFPTKQGHTFVDWYSDQGLNTIFSFSGTMPAQNLIVYAKWTVNQYTITYEVNGGSSINPDILSFGTNLTTPTEPTKAGHTFVGWYVDQGLTNLFNFSTSMPSENITLYAKWTTNQYTITFDSNGGSLVSPITVAYEEYLTEPQAPLRESYNFVGWYLDDESFVNEFDFGNEKIITNLTLYANWEIADVRGEMSYTTPGNFYWTAPAGVTSVSVVAIGGGGGGGFINSSGTLAGGGGGLGWKNSIPVTPGETYLVVVGAGGVNAGHGGSSYFIDLQTVSGHGGQGYVDLNPFGGAPRGANGGSFTGTGGGVGGKGGSGAPAHHPSGGGAGGYTGNGGAAGQAAQTDSGGAGGGSNNITGAPGGGTGIYGKGTTGLVNQGGSLKTGSGAFGQGGYRSNSQYESRQVSGGGGAVRIIWGQGRLFPNTDVGYTYA
jgi:uncharacterized repeat protein (TIGR02543 family)